MTAPTRDEPFRQCPRCASRWKDREEFLTDPATVVAGYQAHFRQLELGLFLFNHARCGTTFALHARIFADLYTGPVFQERKTGTADCQRYCKIEDELGPCTTQCECAWVREVLQIVATWPAAVAV